MSEPRCCAQWRDFLSFALGNERRVCALCIQWAIIRAEKAAPSSKQVAQPGGEE